MLFSLMITGICDFPREGLIDSSGTEYSVMFWKVWDIPGRDRGRTQARIMFSNGRVWFCWTVFLYVGERCLCLKEDILAGFYPEDLPVLVHL